MRDVLFISERHLHHHNNNHLKERPKLSCSPVKNLNFLQQKAVFHKDRLLAARYTVKKKRKNGLKFTQYEEAKMVFPGLKWLAETVWKCLNEITNICVCVFLVIAAAALIKATICSAHEKPFKKIMVFMWKTASHNAHWTTLTTRPHELFNWKVSGPKSNQTRTRVCQRALKRLFVCLLPRTPVSHGVRTYLTFKCDLYRFMLRKPASGQIFPRKTTKLLKKQNKTKKTKQKLRQENNGINICLETWHWPQNSLKLFLSRAKLTPKERRNSPAESGSWSAFGGVCWSLCCVKTKHINKRHN